MPEIKFDKSSERNNRKSLIINLIENSYFVYGWAKLRVYFQ